MTGPTVEEQLSPEGAYRLLRLTVAAMTLGRMMVLAGNDKADPDVQIADANFVRADRIARRYVAALEQVAVAELAGINTALRGERTGLMDTDNTPDAPLMPCDIRNTLGAIQ